MKDLQRMMREAQKMAAEVQRAQEELAGEQFEASAGGGAVKVVVSGEPRVVSVAFDPATVDGADPDDLEMLGDAVVAAVNDALTQVKTAQADAMGPLAGGGGLGLPGL